LTNLTIAGFAQYQFIGLGANNHSTLVLDVLGLG